MNKTTKTLLVIFALLIVSIGLIFGFYYISMSPGSKSVGIASRVQNALEQITIDFSSWQGTINFAIMNEQAVAAYGRCCVGAPSQGGYKDPRWDQNVAGMELQEMAWAPYSIYYPPNVVTESTQFWLSILGEHAYEHPLVIDAELDGGQSVFRVTNRLWDTIVEWERITGIKPWVYSGKWWWDVWIIPGFSKDGLVWNDIVGGYIVADYYSITSPLIPADWDPDLVHLWQFSSKCSGALYGASSDYIDCNRLRNISLDQLYEMWGYNIEELPTPTVAPTFTSTVTPSPTFTETATPTPTPTNTPKPTEEIIPSVTAAPVKLHKYYLIPIWREP